MLKAIKNWLCKDIIEENKRLRDITNKPVNKDPTAILNQLKYKLENEKNFAVIETFRCDDVQYLGKLSEIINSSEFLFHVFFMKSEIVNKIIVGDEKTAVEMQGQLKGIDKLISAMFRADKVYSDMMKAEENKTTGDINE